MQQALRPTHVLEGKVDETNALLRELLSEIKALREKMAPKQVDLREASQIVEHGQEEDEDDRRDREERERQEAITRNSTTGY